MNTNYNIEDIELALSQKVRTGNVSKNVFEGHRPNVLKEEYLDFVVVSVSTSLKDLNTHGKCVTQIQWFVKNLSDGTKNSKKLSLMYKKICELFPIEHNTYIFLQNPLIISLGIDKNGYTVNAIQIQTLIKSITTT